MNDVPTGEPEVPLKPMSRIQRRVLGVLIEKAFTTPEYYPLTLKAVTTGCNQKNNREPVTQYTEEEVEDALNQLREVGVVAVVHTETGRTERWRHWMRRRLTISEAQLAILGELLLRGRQALGELRSRASRMILIESLEQLRAELKGLMDRQLARTNGHLERRGIEVDHALYEAREPLAQAMHPPADDSAPEPVSRPAAAVAAPRPTATVAAPSPASAGPSDVSQRLAAVESLCSTLSRQNQEQQSELAALREELERLTSDLHQLRQSLGA